MRSRLSPIPSYEWPWVVVVESDYTGVIHSKGFKGPADAGIYAEEIESKFNTYAVSIRKLEIKSWRDGC